MHELFAKLNSGIGIRPEVRKNEKKSGGVLILDDSIEEKPYSDENEIMCWHYSYQFSKLI
ncbi:MAG: hypothetical protein QMO91_04700 [Candidatus Tisiphia sp.]|nr:hypothetical protein [Candidatus Tisiphia sp.]